MIKGFISEKWNKCKSTNMVHHINKFKKHMIIILYTETPFFHDKNFGEIRDRDTRDICKQFTASLLSTLT